GRAREGLVLEREDRPGEPLLEARLKVLGADVTRVRASGTPEMLMAPHVSQIPEQTIDPIVRWFDARPETSPKAAKAMAGAVNRVSHAAGTVHDAEHYREEALRFGDGGRFFGVVP